MRVGGTYGASLVAQMVNNLPAVQGTGSIPGLERSPGEGMATLSSILARRIPWTEEPGEIKATVLQRIRHN